MKMLIIADDLSGAADCAVGVAPPPPGPGA